jgi:hypothetical protein
MIDYGEPGKCWQGKHDDRFYSDHRLKHTDKLVLAFLLTKRHTWNPNQAHLAEVLGMSADTIKHVMVRLRQHKYCEMTPRKRTKGYQAPAEYAIFADPTRCPGGPEKHPVKRPRVDKPTWDESQQPCGLSASDLAASADLPTAQRPRLEKPPEPRWVKPTLKVIQDTRTTTKAGEAVDNSPPSFEDRMANMGADLPKDQNRVEYKTNPKTRMPDNWMPMVATLEKLKHLSGIDIGWATDLLPEFETYWKTIGATKDCWDCAFMSHVRRQHQREQGQIHGPTTHLTDYRQRAAERDANDRQMAISAAWVDPRADDIDPNQPIGDGIDYADALDQRDAAGPDPEYGRPFGGPADGAAPRV